MRKCWSIGLYLFEHLTSQAIQFREPAASKVPKKRHGLSGTTWKSRKRGSKGLEIELLARFWQANAIKVRHFSSFALTVGVGQFSVLSSQFSVFSFQFSVFSFQHSALGLRDRNRELLPAHCPLFLRCCRDGAGLHRIGSSGTGHGGVELAGSRGVECVGCQVGAAA